MKPKRKAGRRRIQRATHIMIGPRMLAAPIPNNQRLFCCGGRAVPTIEQRAIECGVCYSDYAEAILTAWLDCGAPAIAENENERRAALGFAPLPWRTKRKDAA